MSRPPTVVFKLSQASCDGQQVSPGKQRHEALSEPAEKDTYAAHTNIRRQGLMTVACEIS